MTYTPRQRIQALYVDYREAEDQEVYGSDGIVRDIQIGLLMAKRESPFCGRLVSTFSDSNP